MSARVTLVCPCGSVNSYSPQELRLERRRVAAGAHWNCGADCGAAWADQHVAPDEEPATDYNDEARAEHAILALGMMIDHGLYGTPPAVALANTPLDDMLKAAHIRARKAATAAYSEAARRVVALELLDDARALASLDDKQLAALVVGAVTPKRSAPRTAQLVHAMAPELRRVLLGGLLADAQAAAEGRPVNVVKGLSLDGDEPRVPTAPEQLKRP